MLDINTIANIAGILTGLLALFGGFKAIYCFIQKRRYLIDSLARAAGELDEKKYLSDFKKYVKHKVKDVSGKDGKITQEYNVKFLKKTLKPHANTEKIVFLFGVPGSGKSTLMQHMAYWYCIYNNKAKEIETDLRKCGVLYYRMHRIKDLEELKSWIVDELNNEKTVEAIFLDGFDEYVILQNRKAEYVLKELFQFLFIDEKIKNKMSEIRKIYISSRKEPFGEKPEDFIRMLELPYAYRIVEVCPFDIKQSLLLYKRKGKKDGKGKHFFKMSKYLREKGKKSIFDIPLFIEYADIILESSFDSKMVLSIGEAVCLIVQYWLEREYRNSYVETNANKDFNIDSNNFYEDSWEIIDNICLKILDEKCEMFDLVQIMKNSSCHNRNASIQDMFYLATRQIIKKSGEKEYEFIHSIFHDFFMAHLLVTNQCVEFNKKREILIDKNSLIEEFYAYWIWKGKNDFLRKEETWGLLVLSLKNSISEYVIGGNKREKINELEQIKELLIADRLVLREYTEVRLTLVLWYFPLIKSAKWKSYVFSQEKILDLMGDNRKLSLVEGELKSLRDLSCLGPFDELDIQNNELEDIDELPTCTLKELCLYGNPISGFNSLDKMKIQILRVSVYNDHEDLLDEIFSLSCWEECHIELPETAQAYTSMHRLHTKRPKSYLKVKPEVLKLKEVFGFDNLKCRHCLCNATFELLRDTFAMEKVIDNLMLEFGVEEGICIYKEGNYEGALERFAELRNLEDEYEFKFSRVEGWIGYVLAKIGKYEEAIPFLDEVCGQEWSEGLEAEMNLFWYWKVKCEKEINRNVNIKNYKIIDDCGVLAEWGDKLYRAGEYNEAEIVLQKCYERYCEKLGNKAEKTLYVLGELGVVFYMQKKYEDAKRELVKCYEVGRNELGENDRIMLDVRKFLDMTMYEIEKEK